MSKKFLLPTSAKACRTRPSSEWYVKRRRHHPPTDDKTVSMETAEGDCWSACPRRVNWQGAETRRRGGATSSSPAPCWPEFEVDASIPQRAEGQDTGHHHGPSYDTPNRRLHLRPPPRREGDAGTVVGAMQVGDAGDAGRRSRWAGSGDAGGARDGALARRRYRRVAPSGADSTVTMDDVKRAAADGSANRALRLLSCRRANRGRTCPAPAPSPASCARSQTASRSRTQPPGVAATDQPDNSVAPQTHGSRYDRCARRVVPTTLVSMTADLPHETVAGTSLRGWSALIVVAAAGGVPALNAWFDG